MADTVNGAMVVTWRPRWGAPQDQTLNVLAQVVGYWNERQKEGKVSGFRIYSSTQGSGAGLMVIEGRLTDLAALSVESEGLRLLAKANTVVDGLSTAIYAGGSVDDVTQYFLNGMAAAAEVTAG